MKDNLQLIDHFNFILHILIPSTKVILNIGFPQKIHLKSHPMLRKFFQIIIYSPKIPDVFW